MSDSPIFVGGGGSADPAPGRNLCYNGRVTVWQGQFTDSQKLQRYVTDGYVTLSAGGTFTYTRDTSFLATEGVVITCVDDDMVDAASLYSPVELIQQEPGGPNQFPIGTTLTLTKRIKMPLGSTVEFRLRWADSMIGAAEVIDDLPWTQVGVGTGAFETYTYTHTITTGAGSLSKVLGFGALVRGNGGAEGAGFSISETQMEYGSKATEVEWVPMERELAACQRYRWRWIVYGMNFGADAANRVMSWPFACPVDMYLRNPVITTKFTGVQYFTSRDLGAVGLARGSFKLILYSTASANNCYFIEGSNNHVELAAYL